MVYLAAHFAMQLAPFPSALSYSLTATYRAAHCAVYERSALGIQLPVYFPEQKLS